MRPSTRLSRFGLPDKVQVALLVVGLLLGWEMASRVGYLDSYAFPPPSQLAKTLWMLSASGFPRGLTVWRHVQVTIVRIVEGYSLAAVLAIPCGLLIGATPFLDRAGSPVVTFARSIATISLLPLAVAWFGVGELSKVLLIAYGCFWVVLTHTSDGVKNADRELVRAGRMLGCNPVQLFMRVVLPAIAPFVFSGMKVALGLSFMVIVGVEMVGTVAGLGALIIQAETFYRSDVAMVGMVFIGAFGFGLAAILGFVERRLFPWVSRTPGASQ